MGIEASEIIFQAKTMRRYIDRNKLGCVKYMSNEFKNNA